MPEEPQPTPSRRSRRGGQLLAGLLVGVLGFAIAVQVGPDDESSDFAAMRGVELVELLKSIDAANARLAGQVDDLTRTRDELRSARDGSASAKEQAELNAEQLAILAGSVGAEGPGVRLTLKDPDGSLDAGILLDAIEELRAAGAEAIVINGSARVVAQTYFLDDEGGVRVGGREVEAPYVVEAIGDPATLQEAMSFRGGVIDRVESRGGEADVRTSRRLTITALADVKSPEYARPDAGADDAPSTP
ncbi:DUF881 domain-containing protein [Aeromicrobium sp. CF4.19]|uniref:DUF881 domain-containing protein n=1 Tax=Aeromicrobium sp. CF4.19 TaxID=3373082 RepID=UPI003EE7FCB2